MPVSILIRCFNAERWVAQAIESAFSQTWRAKEVILVDDGSADASLTIIKISGDRICWVGGPNSGVNCAVVRNRLWQEVLQRAVQLDLRTTARIRSSLLDLARSHLCPATATRDWLGRMGVTQ